MSFSAVSRSAYPPGSSPTVHDVAGTGLLSFLPVEPAVSIHRHGVPGVGLGGVALRRRDLSPSRLDLPLMSRDQTLDQASAQPWSFDRWKRRWNCEGRWAEPPAFP
jgi:hypothetical protein